MITDVFIVYDNEEHKRKVEDSVKVSPTFHFINSLSRKSRKKALTLKSYWGAKLNPFAIVLDKDKPIKAFYSESEDVINNLILYLNEQVD